VRPRRLAVWSVFSKTRSGTRGALPEPTRHGSSRSDRMGYPGDLGARTLRRLGGRSADNVRAGARWKTEGSGGESCTAVLGEPFTARRDRPGEVVR
jgi:hypothetical protein